MRNLTIFSILTFLVSFVAASPIYQPRQLVPRAAAPLWNESGPRVKDVRQVKVLNCWWAASSLAVLMSSQKWIENMVRYSNGSSMTGQSWPSDSTVQVTVWNPTNFQQETHVADHSYISQTEDFPTRNWWHDSIGQAARAMGKTSHFDGVLSGPNPDWDPNTGSANIGLTILTGFETDFRLREFMTIDEFFEYCERAATGTPVIFNTMVEDEIGVTVPQLGHSHDYAVFNGSTNADGERVIWARNSWGSTDAFKLEDVYYNSFKIVYLKNWNVLGGGPFDTAHQDSPASNSTSNSSSPTNSTSSAAPSSTGNETSTATATDSGAAANSTATPISSEGISTVPSGYPSSAAASAPSSVSGYPSQPETTSAAPPATSSAAAGGESQPWQWTSMLPGWSTTFPSTPVGTQALVAAVEVPSERSDDDEDQSENTIECKRNNADGACQ
ncbi:hypothetical protein I302_106528 [Kwoniella bestiolae CBS 10118]|uniref:Calpain catalytic domain-containing protein n=1 Tax=Kwoniella bestiolae CBS 10118 TaxID=1296100 RepID=A0A1B9G152_9TREE|nr:hypothetical protein I302_06213 [Kwoniella bestiolae CBS 10118]OCF24752.1 hypothetical protein I302_06213 [Kwoniella bestiolae CBS 10118]